jgi:EAL domain-containing protein (putative c-di-GMP-specific phosphodiesterase class I)/integral membrane sensor domain MASE1
MARSLDSVPAPGSIPAREPTALRRPCWREYAFATATLLVSACISQGLSFSDLAFSLFWPPAGIAFALCWRYGAHALPMIVFGILVPTFLLYPGWGSGLVVLGEAAGPFVGAIVLNRLSPPPTTGRPLQWQISFYVCGLLIACPIAAVFGSLGAVVDHRFPWSDLLRVVSGYVVVEAIGLVLFGPLLIDGFESSSNGGRRDGDGHQLRASWVFLAPPGIEVARWFLHSLAGGAYGDLLIYGYFPLVAWSALTSSTRRCGVLLIWITVVTLSSEAFRLHSSGATAADFSVFRIALVSLILATMGQVLGALASERRAAFADVARQRDLDPLTGLLNETSFARALERLPRPFAVSVLAFDNWSEFELLAGIGAGADLQREVAELLRAAPHLAAVARIQPGVFAALSTGDADWPPSLAPLLERRWSNEQVDMRLIGVAIGLQDPDDTSPSELLLGARTLLNEALLSRDYGPIAREWHPSLMSERRSYERLVEVIKHQVRGGQLRLFAQPIVQIRSSQLPSLEILVRIPDEHGAILSSAAVAHVLSHNLVSAELDRAVVRGTFAWFAAHPDALRSVARVAINLTGASLSSPSLFDWIEESRTAAGLSAQKFSFEVTESQAILNMDCALSLVRRLRDAGYGVALDDFGTGLATFDYLKRFTVDYLKIDGSFVRNLARSPVDREIVTGIVRLARLMGIGTVAEYVADPDIAEAAMIAGVDALQGYVIQPPIPLADAIDWCSSAGSNAWSDATDRTVKSLAG